MSNTLHIEFKPRADKHVRKLLEENKITTTELMDHMWAMNYTYVEGIIKLFSNDQPPFTREQYAKHCQELDNGTYEKQRAAFKFA